MSDYPYAGTSGWSGSDTSRERQEREDATGITGWRSREVFKLIASAGEVGMTDKEVQSALRIGHGASSGTLTRLHKAEKIARLRDRRRGNEIYVLPRHVQDRTTSPYRPNKRTSDDLREVRAQAWDEGRDAAVEHLDRAGFGFTKTTLVNPYRTER